MEFRKNYYTDAEQYNPGADDSASGMDEKQLARMDEIARRAIDEHLKKQKNTVRAINPEKQAAFDKIARDADDFAQAAGMDISVRISEIAGVIILSADSLLLKEPGENNALEKVFYTLISQSDQVWFRTEEDLLVIELCYELADETEKRQ